jgi:hypothetical protein
MCLFFTRKRNCLLIFSFTFLLGCASTTATLYPVEGPLSESSPLPILTGKVEGITGNSGNLTLIAQDGEEFSGRWSVIAPTSTKVSSMSASAVATSGLGSAWASVYGTGVSVERGARINSGQAMLIGNMGTVIDIEFKVGGGTASGYGVGKDNKGNIFKVIF